MAALTLPETKTTTETRIYKWPRQGEWTYEDYRRLPDDRFRYEIIGGNLYMSPAPRTKHQLALFELAMALNNFAQEQKAGQVLIAPIDVILPDLATPVQPDIMFIAQDRLEIVREQFIEGAPDLIVEVLSPGNARHDRYTKFRLYLEAGVKEYWIADPDACTVDVYVPRGNAYVPLGHFALDGDIQSELFPELRIPVKDIFSFEL
ncbi:MAG TPA: Uma2 family endonuclease [Anaerolineae bacterium]|nr:Uma2 family endonuclease [Anaerolineae bacterium]HIP71168.1 Uma2 family endonuclease [Anaerolineae bacterium]